MMHKIRKTAFVALLGLLLVLSVSLSDAQGKGKRSPGPGPNNLSVSITDVKKPETDTGTTDFRFVATLSPPAPAGGANVEWDVQDGTARVTDGDFEPGRGKLFLPEGTTQLAIVVKVKGDTAREGDETFQVRLWLSGNKGRKNENIVYGTGTIENDDSQYELTIEDVTDYEGHRLTTPFTFLVTCNTRIHVADPEDGDRNETIVVPWKTIAGSAGDGDYEAANGTLIFRPGDRYKTIQVNVKNDNQAESPDETFTVELDLPANVKGDTLTATGTIKDDGLDRFAGYFVSPDGDDANSGTTTDAPFRSLAKGISMLKAGDTLYLLEGVHPAERIEIGSLQGTPSQPIHIRAFTGDHVVVAGTRSLGTGGWSPITEDDANYQKYFRNTAGADAIGRIYRKDIDFDISRLYVDGREIGQARWPDAPAWSDLSWDRWNSGDTNRYWHTGEASVDSQYG